VNILIEKNIMVPMRDGVQLATDVYRPAGDGLYPLIIKRLPYNKDLPAITMLLIDIFRLVQQGYAIAGSRAVRTVWSRRSRWRSS